MLQSSSALWKIAPRSTSEPQNWILYGNFSRGAEAWEIHEIVRNCVLISTLIILPEVSQRKLEVFCFPL